jgi:hypothetical protein
MKDSFYIKHRLVKIEGTSQWSKDAGLKLAGYPIKVEWERTVCAIQ